MRSRTARTSSGVMSATPWSAAACPATWAKIPSSSAAEKRAPQPGMTSPQAKVFMGGLLVVGDGADRPTSDRGLGSADLRRRGREVLDAQQADHGAAGVGAQDRVEADGGNAG